MLLAVSISNDPMLILHFLFENMFFLFERCPEFERFGVYSDNVFYYLSTNPDINVVKHLVDEGKRVKEIEGCKIPNHHLERQHTRHLQG